MKIRDLFIKPVERPIEGVIKADDLRNLETEVEEYVVTTEVSRGLDQFVERYLNEPNANGVWISGFFGSGKSHLLKILSLLLENHQLSSGVLTADLLLPKIEDELLRGDLLRCIKIPSRSILFNIDQKSDSIGGDRESPVLEVFIKVLNELQGYYAKQGHIAQFEYDLDIRGELKPLKEAYAKATGRTWEEDLPVLETLENETFARVYADHFSKSYEQGLKVFDRMRENYRVSIEDFAQRVKKYIDGQDKSFRLNFFVDEAGQFIGQDSKLMLNLQTIAETLSTVCGGRAWVFVTSQGDLQKVLGELRVEQGQDFTKIEARFKTRLTLTGADVREVIQKRLLAKRDPEPEVLTKVYEQEKDNFQTLYRFGDGSIDFKSWRNVEDFCSFYPFHPYLFDLFQRAIEQLSRHEAFTGKHTSVGERSMLAVFQDVAKTLCNEDVGRLASFDLMFEGIAASLRGDIQTSVRQAEHHLDDPVAIRIIKALFLLKWVRNFQASPRNVAILLIDRPDIDIRKHEKSVRDALNLLAAQSYLQRNGEIYEFLTDTEKDIEVEIKNTDIEEYQLSRLLAEVLFADILRDPKIRYEGNGQDYSYARKLDDQLMGKDADLSINLITPDHPNHGDPTTLAAQNTGKAELLAVLPANSRMIDEARLYLKTNKFVQQNTGGSMDESRRVILIERGRQNSTRRTTLQAICSELMSQAPLYLNGSRLVDVGEGDPRNRFAKASQELISFAFPNLRMLKGTYDEVTLSQALLDPDDLFAGTAQSLSEPEQELMTYIMRNQQSGERISIEEIARAFGRRPYGWYPMAVLTLIARLFRMGKVELREADLLDARAALEGLKNSRRHGGVRVRLQEQFDASKVNKLKRFHHEFFDRINEATEPRAVAQLTLEALAGEVRDLQLLLDQAGTYHFLSKLQPVIERLDSIAKKDYSYLLNHLSDFATELLEAKETLLIPIKAFMHGAQRQAYDQVISFYREQQANFAEVSPEDLEPLQLLIHSEQPFTGDILPNARAAVAKLRKVIEQKLVQARETALKSLENRQTQIKKIENFPKLSKDDQERVLAASEKARSEISVDGFVSSIHDRIFRYSNREYPEQLAVAERLAGGKGPDGQTEPQYIPVGAIRAACSLPYISTEEDLNEWLAALRKAALAELNKGKRISL